MTLNLSIYEQEIERNGHMFSLHSPISLATSRVSANFFLESATFRAFNQSIQICRAIKQQQEWLEVSWSDSQLYSSIWEKRCWWYSYLRLCIIGRGIDLLHQLSSLSHLTLSELLVMQTRPTYYTPNFGAVCLVAGRQKCLRKIYLVCSYLSSAFS